MRKFFGKQGWNKVLSVVLVMALVAGVVGVYPIMAKANETVPEGIFTVEELKTGYSSFGLSATQTNEGVSITYPSESADAFARVITASTYSLNEYGIHLDITNIACSTRDDYSFVMYFGNATNPLYDQDGYMLVYENSGVFSIIATGITSDTVKNPTPKNAPKVVGPIMNVEPLDGEISLDIKLVNDNYVLNVNGNSYTIAAKYQGDATQAIQDVSNVRLSFAILDDGLADNSFSYSQTFACATYTIESITYNVGGVTLDASALSMVPNQTTNLTATVFPDNISNKTVTWKSSDQSIVTVDDNGNVTAVEEGGAIITATSNADITKSATCEVKVAKSNLSKDDFTGLNVTNATFTDAANSGGVQITYPTTASGSERIRTVNTYPMQNGVSIQIDNINGETGLYSVALAIGNNTQQWNDSVGYMLVFGQSGNFIISQTPSGEDNNNPDCSVVVSDNMLGELTDGLSITIKKQDSDYKVWVNGKEYVIQDATSVLGTSGEHFISFGVMSDFSLTNGEASGLKHWHYGYYAQAWGSIGRSEDVSYIVRSISVSPSSVALDKKYLNLFVEENASLTAAVSPLTASQSVKWTSADEAIATVDDNGTVIAVKAGTTIITATSKTDASITASCVVKVTNPTEYITTDMLSNSGSWPTVENITEGIKVSYSADTASWRRIDGAYNDNLKHGYWLEGNGVHIGLKDIELANDSDAIAVFMGDGLKSSGVHDSLWYDAEEGGYMLFYSKGGSFSIVKIVKTAKTETVLVSEKREALGDRLSLDIRLEDGKYEFSVNGKTYSIPGVPSEDAACPISNDSRVYFSFGLIPGFGVTDGVVTGPNFGATTYGSDGTFTLTNISHVTTEELTLPVYSQQATLKGFEGEYVIGGGDVALTTTLGMETFDGTPNDSKEDILWEVAAVDDVEDGYTVKQTGGTHYLNISGTGVSCSETAQTLYITRTRTTTAAYTTISDGTNYLCVSSEGVSASTTPDKLILYSVTPELSQATEKEPLFTLSAFADLHGERIYYNGEEYIRDGIIDATKKVGQNENANVIAFLGDLISSKSTSDAIKGYDGYWDYYQRGAEEKDRLSVLEQWQTARDAMYTAAASATKSGRALYLTGNHEFKIGSLNTSDNGGAFNSGDYTDGIQSHLPQLISGDNAYYQAEWPEGTSEDIKAAGHVLSYYYNIDGMDILAINTTYTGTEITSGWNYDLGALEWMENKLEEIGEDKTVIVLGHYPTESLNNSVGQQSYTKIKSIFAKYPNVIYLTGHTHDPYIHTDTYERVQTFAKDAYTAFDNRYESPTGYIEAFAGSVAFTNDIGLSGCAEDGTPVVVQGLLVKVYSDRIVLQMKNYNESPLGVDALREYTIMRDVKLNIAEEPQEVETVEYTTAFANFRAGKEKEAPVAPKGYVFAGWYYDEACTKPVANETVNVAEDEQIFAKFLPQDVLSVKAQLKLAEGTTTDSAEGKTEMRLITTIDAKLDYQNVGFLINGKPYTCQYAYTSLKAAGFEKTPDVFNSCSKRFVTRNIINLSWNTTTKLVDRPIKVQAFWTTGDGTVIYGQERIITIKQGLDAIDSSGTADYSLR